MNITALSKPLIRFRLDWSLRLVHGETDAIIETLNPKTTPSHQSPTLLDSFHPQNTKGMQSMGVLDHTGCGTDRICQKSPFIHEHVLKPHAELSGILCAD